MDLQTEHGLSLYIETAGHKVLFDTGATDRFLENAEKLGVDLTAVDTLVLSHGHYDHTGGVKVFLELQPAGEGLYPRKRVCAVLSQRRE